MKLLLPAAAAALLAAACAPSTPQARIDAEPAKFAALPPEHQALVRKGELTRGMSREAVALAWGAPDSVFRGSRHNRPTERWDYAGATPVTVGSFAGCDGMGFGPHTPYGPYGRHSYYGFPRDMAFIPYRIASVWFIDGKADSWERGQ
jgi:hypothetical protein